MSFSFTDSRSYIGQTVTAKIDRPVGSKKPEYETIYTVNYGYVPNTVSGDGEEIDCYILGVFEQIEEYTGECIAVIHRTDDSDDKLVLADKNYSNEAIEALTEFQERFFEHEIWR